MNAARRIKIITIQHSIVYVVSFVAEERNPPVISNKSRRDLAVQRLTGRGQAQMSAPLS